MDDILGWFLGESVQKLATWYSENNLLINGLIVFVVIISLLSPKATKPVMKKINAVWQRSFLATPEEDKKIIQEVKERYQNKYKNINGKENKRE